MPQMFPMNWILIIMLFLWVFYISWNMIFFMPHLKLNLKINYYPNNSMNYYMNKF